jgi:hypothetical protein
MWTAASAVCLGSQNRLTVVVLNYTDVGIRDLERATGLSRELFQRIGVESTWSVCARSERCDLPPIGTYVRMIVAPQAMGLVLGFASKESIAAGNPQAYAFLGPVAKLAERTRCPLPVALARVMVHEVLHLFGLEHASFGIMRTTIGRQGLVNLASEPMLVASQVRQVHQGLSRLRPALAAAEK